MHIEYDRLKMTDLTLRVWLTKVKYRNTNVTNLKMLLNLLLKSDVGLDRSPSHSSLCSHWLGHLPSLTCSLSRFYWMLHWSLSPVRDNVKSFMEVSHLTKFGWSFYKLPKSVKLTVVLKDLVHSTKRHNLRLILKVLVNSS